MEKTIYDGNCEGFYKPEVFKETIRKLDENDSEIHPVFGGLLPGGWFSEGEGTHSIWSIHDTTLRYVNYRTQEQNKAKVLLFGSEQAIGEVEKMLEVEKLYFLHFPQEVENEIKKRALHIAVGTFD